MAKRTGPQRSGAPGEGAVLVRLDQLAEEKANLRTLLDKRIEEINEWRVDYHAMRQALGTAIEWVDRLITGNEVKWTRADANQLDLLRRIAEGVESPRSNDLPPRRLPASPG